MKKFTALALALLMVLMTAACGGGASSSAAPAAPATSEAAADAGSEAAAPAAGGNPTYTFKLASVAPDNAALCLTVQEFAKKVGERTGGDILIEVYPNSQLGSSNEYVPQVMEGNIAMCTLNNDSLATFYSEFDVFNAPFVFNNKEECDALCDGPIGAELFAIPEKDNIMVLNPGATTYNGTGFRLVTANKEIRTPDDMQGLKIRVMENQILLASWQALGANPTPVAFTELFTALQQNAVEAQENPMDLIYNMKFYEAQDYLMTTNHLLQPAPIGMNMDLFNDLPEEYQTILLEEAEAAGHYQRQLGADLEAQFLEEIEASGVTYVELTDAEREAFRAEMGEVYQMVKDSAGPIADKFFDELGITV